MRQILEVILLVLLAAVAGASGYQAEKHKQSAPEPSAFTKAEMAGPIDYRCYPIRRAAK